MREQSTKQMDEYLIELIASVIEQRESLLNKTTQSLERIYKMSDYHHVSNIAYYKIMWEDDIRLKKVKNKFQNRYRYSIQLQEDYNNVRKQLSKELEKRHMSAVFLGEAIYLPYYTYPEMRMPQPIQVLIDEKNIDKILSIMNIMDFSREVLEEQSQNDEDVTNIIVYKKNDDLKIEFYTQLNFNNKKVDKWFKNIFNNLFKQNIKYYIREMNCDFKYIYTICMLSQKFSHAQIELRDMVDFWVFLSKEKGNINWKKVNVELENFKLQKFADYIMKLTGKWFGRMNFLEDAKVLINMQEYIMSKGEKARKENEKILPIIKKVVDTYKTNDEENNKEELTKLQKIKLFLKNKFIEK